MYKTPDQPLWAVPTWKWPCLFSREPHDEEGMSLRDARGRVFLSHKRSRLLAPREDMSPWDEGYMSSKLGYMSSKPAKSFVVLFNTIPCDMCIIQFYPTLFHYTKHPSMT